MTAGRNDDGTDVVALCRAVGLKAVRAAETDAEKAAVERIAREIAASPGHPPSQRLLPANAANDDDGSGVISLARATGLTGIKPANDI